MREVDDIPCGGLPDAMMLHVALLGLLGQDNVLHTSVIVSAFHSLLELQRVRRSLSNELPTGASFRSRRVSYLLGEFASFDAFASSLERYERTLLYRHDLHSLLETFSHAASFILQRFGMGEAMGSDACIELLGLRDIVNSAFKECGALYGRKHPTLESDWSWSFPNHRRRRT